MKRVFKSGISIGLLSILLSVFSTVTVLLILDDAPWYALLIIFLVVVFILQLFFNTYYVIEGSLLKIRSGFLYRIDIDIKTIKKIEESNSPLSSPAASFDRLEIIYNKFDSVLISPKEKKEFIELMLIVNPAIEIIYQK